METLLVHLCEARLPKPSSHGFAQRKEDEHDHVVRQYHTTEDARKHSDVPVLRDPVKDCESKAKGDGLLSNVHSDQHLRHIGFVRIHGICKRVGQVKEVSCGGKKVGQYNPSTIHI